MLEHRGGNQNIKCRKHLAIDQNLHVERNLGSQQFDTYKLRHTDSLNLLFYVVLFFICWHEYKS